MTSSSGPSWFAQWWDALDPTVPENWVAIGFALFLAAAYKHTRRLGWRLTLPNPQETSKIFVNVGGVYGLFLIGYVVLKHKPLTDAKSAIFYIFAAVFGAGVEKVADLLGIDVAPAAALPPPSSPPPPRPSLDIGGNNR